MSSRGGIVDPGYVTLRPGDAGFVAVFACPSTGVVNVYGPYPTRGKARTEVNRAMRERAAEERQTGKPLPFVMAKVRPLLTQEMFGVIP